MRFLFIFFSIFSLLANAQTEVFTVYFDHDKDQLSTKEKDQLFELLKDKPHLKVTSLIAYCDTVGSKAYNLDLAKRRLEHVQSLISASITKESELSAFGEYYPSSKPSIPLKECRKVEVHYTNAVFVAINDSSGIKQSEPAHSVFDDLTLEDVLAEKAEPLVLDIQFVPGLDVLYGNSWVELDKLFQFLKKNDKVHAFIRGHVCCGSDMYLSYSRAYVVYNSMIKRGISPKRLEIKGFDNTKPRVWPELTDEDRQMNRRVDVIFSLPEE